MLLQIRNETKLDTNVVPPLKVSKDPQPAPVAVSSEKPIDLNQSLSSAFFSGISKRPASASKQIPHAASSDTTTASSVAASVPAQTASNEV